MVLDGDVFDVPIRKDIVHRVVRWQLAKRQQVQPDISFSLLGSNSRLPHYCNLLYEIFWTIVDLPAHREHTQLKLSVKWAAQEENLTIKKELAEHDMVHCAALRLCYYFEYCLA